MMKPLPSSRSLSAVVFVLGAAFLTGCPDKGKDGAGMVADAAGSTIPTSADAGVVAPLADTSRCAGCALTAQAAWTFEGIYRDDKCTDPVAQMTVSSCGVLPNLGDVSLTYADGVGGRKAGEVANVSLTEQIAATTTRYRKTDKGCTKANEGATDIAPPGCAGQKVCRDATGQLACTNCRTFADGCPDFEETRLYAAVNDPTAKAGGTGGGGGNLRTCCNAIAAEAKRLGSSPEAGVLNSAAAQCMALVAQSGPNGTAPELATIRTLLAGRKIPGCNF
jgi:hypothetical protein